MARARNIKPAFFKNYELADAGPVAQILFAGLWCLADREGRMEDKPRLIKAELFPYYDCDVNGELTVLERLGFVRRYVNAGISIIEVLNFKKHQAPHKTEKDSVLPAYDAESCTTTPLQPAPSGGNGGLTVKQPSNNYGKTPDSLIPDSLSSDSLIPDSSSQAPSSGLVQIDKPESKKPKPSSPSAKFDPLDHCPANVSADVWAKWVQCRKEQGKPLKQTTCEAQAKQLEGISIADSVIEKSIAAGWQGLFPDKVKGNVHQFPVSNHTGFESRDYSEGLVQREDGTYGLA